MTVGMLVRPLVVIDGYICLYFTRPAQ